MKRYRAASQGKSSGLTDVPVTHADLPDEWRYREGSPQQHRDAWDGARALLQAPSAIVPIARAPDRNALTSQRYKDAATIATMAVEPFLCDSRLFRSPPRGAPKWP